VGELSSRLTLDQLTSFDASSLQDKHPRDPVVRKIYLPIYPSDEHPDNRIRLCLADGVELIKPSYINTKNKYQTDWAVLWPYSKDGRVYKLTSCSFSALVRYRNSRSNNTFDGIHEDIHRDTNAYPHTLPSITSTTPPPRSHPYTTIPPTSQRGTAVTPHLSHRSSIYENTRVEQRHSDLPYNEWALQRRRVNPPPPHLPNESPEVPPRELFTFLVLLSIAGVIGDVFFCGGKGVRRAWRVFGWGLRTARGFLRAG
jgi:hypothetical protein